MFQVYQVHKILLRRDYLRQQQLTPADFNSALSNVRQTQYNQATGAIVTHPVTQYHQMFSNVLSIWGPTQEMGFNPVQLFWEHLDSKIKKYATVNQYTPPRRPNNELYDGLLGRLRLVKDQAVMFEAQIHNRDEASWEATHQLRPSVWQPMTAMGIFMAPPTADFYMHPNTFQDLGQSDLFMEAYNSDDDNGSGFLFGPAPVAHAQMHQSAAQMHQSATYSPPVAPTNQQNMFDIMHTLVSQLEQAYSSNQMAIASEIAVQLAMVAGDVGSSASTGTPVVFAAFGQSTAEHSLRMPTNSDRPPLDCWACTNHPLYNDT